MHKWIVVHVYIGLHPVRLVIFYPFRQQIVPPLIWQTYFSKCSLRFEIFLIPDAFIMTDRHTVRLQNMCRVCGAYSEDMKRKRLCKAATYSTVLSHIFGISVQDDSAAVHPERLCNNCSVYTRHAQSVYKRRKKNITASDLNRPMPNIFKFQKCSGSSCRVCSEETVEPQLQPLEVDTVETSTSTETPLMSPAQSDISDKTTSSGLLQPLALDTVEPSTSTETPLMSPAQSDISDIPSSSGLLQTLEVDTVEPSTSTETPLMSPAQSDISDIPSSSGFSSPEMSSHKRVRSESESPKLPTKSVKRTLIDDSEHELDFLRTEITSIPLDIFKQHQLASLFECSICKGIPSDAIQTTCHHIFCRKCLDSWMHLQSACPCCRQPLEQNDIVRLYGASLFLYNSLVVKCENNPKGCKFEGSLERYIIHKTNCVHQGKSIVRGHSMKKKSLDQLDNSYRKKYRLKNCIPVVHDVVNKFCMETFEDNTDVYFALLVNHLDTKSDPRKDLVEKVWKGQTSKKLSVDQCLAMRVGNLQSKRHYTRQYRFFQQCQSENPYQPPGALTKREFDFMPGTVRYNVEGHHHADSLYHTPAKIGKMQDGSETEPIDITADFNLNVPEVFCPNVTGVRWSYPDCIAKTLNELYPIIKAGLEQFGWTPRDTSILFKAFIKDGADGLGDVSVYKEKRDRPLPDKAFRASFCIFRIDALKGDKCVTVFEEEDPNSIRTNRPYSECIADENDRPSAILCSVPMESERKFLKGKVLKVECSSGFLRFEIDFYNSMIDEKFDRSEGGLQGSGSNFICTLCEATRQTAVSNLGTFDITRTYEGTKQVAEYLELNPDKLTAKQLDKLAKGVKSIPILQSDAIKKGLDATHADINMGRFFKNLICREVAQVTTWALTADVKPEVVDAEKRVDKLLKVKLGLNPSLMQGGNYARVLFEESNVNEVIALVPNARKSVMANLLGQFRLLRKVYRSNSPLKDMPEDVAHFKENAVVMGNFLLENFSYVSWPNYLHKIIEHTQELIQNPSGPGTVGGLSGEGNEGGNKVFRQFRRDLSRKCGTKTSLVDVLKMHWLYSSPTLINIAKVSLSQRSCSWCHSAGHDIRTCKLRSEIKKST